MSLSNATLARTCTWSAGRHLAQLVAPGRRPGDRAHVAVRLPSRVRADVEQARRIAASAERANGTGVWIVGDKRPDPAGDSGSLRLAWIVLIALRRGHDVTLYSLRERAWLRPRFGDDAPASLALEPTGDPAGSPSVAWIAQPDAACVAMPMLASTVGARIVYDTVDLHHRRLAREAAVTGSRGRRAQSLVVRALERRAIRAADIAIAISDEELPLVERLGARQAAVVPNIHEPRADEPPAHAARSAVLFVGNYAHQPNVDAVDVLVREVMPRLWATHPDLELLVVGRSLPAHVFSALDPRVKVLGWVEDLDAALDAALVLVAPLRFGAGLKGKVGYAMARGTPVVTTTVGAEGFPDNHALSVSEAGDWDVFAAQVRELLEDVDVWAARSRAGIATVRERFAPEVVEPVIAAVLEGA